MQSRRRVSFWRLPGLGVLRSADLRVPGAVPPRGRLHHRAVNAALLTTAALALAGCSNGDDQAKKFQLGDLDVVTYDCEIDPSLSTDSPYLGMCSGGNACMSDGDCATGTCNTDTFNTELAELFCPLRDQDFWKVTTTSPLQIVTAELSYVKLSNIRMAMDWYGPTGTRPIGGALEDLGSGATTQHRLVASFSALDAGDYILAVFDNSEQAADDFVKYTLNLTQTTNPDGHEPNDTVDIATALGTGTGGTADAFLATEDDTDWYQIDYTGSTPPIITVEVRWPGNDTDIAPDWDLMLDEVAYPPNGWTYPAPDVEVDGIDKVRRATIVAPEASPFLLRVFNGGASDLLTGYSVSVTITEDPREGAQRNDTPETATVMNLGSSYGSLPTRTETLVADNDRDWFRFDAAASQNSLLYVSITGTPTGTVDDNFDYLLEATFYETCTCGTGGCNANLPTDDPSTCLKQSIWYRLPNPDGLRACDQCDPSTGGRTPNELEVQLPIRNQSARTLYMLVNHIAATPFPLEGHSASKTYSIDIAHRQEPDSGDLNPGNEDSRFISRPLAGTGADPSDFRLRWRGGAGAGGTSGGGGTSSAFAMIDAGSSAAPTPSAGSEVCSTLNFSAFDGRGASSSQTVTFSSSDGGFIADCATHTAGNTGTGSLQKTGASGTVGFIPNPGLSNDPTLGVPIATITASAGSSNIDFPVPVSASPPSAITVSGSNNAIVGGFTGTITVNAASGTTTVSTVSGSGSVACLEASSTGECPGSPSCTAGGVSPSCTLPGGGAYEFAVKPSGASLFVIELSNGSQVPAIWVVAGWEGQTWTYNEITGGEGYISFAGDNDFFEIPMNGSLVKGEMAVTLYHSPGITLRLGVLPNKAFIDNCNSSTCSFPGSRCSYVTSASTLQVEVNEVNHDDWDEQNPYYFFIEFTEGCPSTCNAYTCAR